MKSLLAAVALDATLEATAPPLAVEDIPRGSVPLFERTSKVTLEEGQDDVHAKNLEDCDAEPLFSVTATHVLTLNRTPIDMNAVSHASDSEYIPSSTGL